MEKDLDRPQEDEQVATPNAGRGGAERFLRSAALAAQVTAALVGINALLERDANAEHRNGRVVVAGPPEVTHGDVQEVEAEMKGVIVGSELRTNGKVSIEVSLDEGKKRTNSVTREPKRTVNLSSITPELQGQRVSVTFSGERKGGNLFMSKITIRVPAILVAKSGSTVRLKNRINDADLTKDDIAAVNALLAALGGSGQLFGTRADFIHELLNGAEKDPEARIDAKTDGEKTDDVFSEDVVIKLTFDRRASDVNGLLLSLGKDERPTVEGSDGGSSCGRCVAKRPQTAAPKGPEQGTVRDSFIMDACSVIASKDPFSDTGTSLSFKREGADVWPVTADGSSKDLEFDVVPVDEKDRIGSQMATVTVTGVSKDGRTFKYRTVLPVGLRSQCNFMLVSASPPLGGAVAVPATPGAPGAQAVSPAASIKPGEFATQVAGLIKDGKLNLSASGAENLLHILFGDAKTNAEIELTGLPASLKAALQDAVLSGYVNGEAEKTGIKRTLRLHMDKEFTDVALQELLSLLHLVLPNNLLDGPLIFDVNLDFPKLSVQIFSQGKLIAVQNNAVALNPGQTYPNIAMRILIQGQKTGDKIAGKAVVDVNTELPDGRNVKEGVVTSYAELTRRLLQQPPESAAPPALKLTGIDANVRGDIQDGNLRLWMLGDKTVLNRLFGNGINWAQIALSGVPKPILEALKEAAITGSIEGNADASGALQPSLKLHMQKVVKDVPFADLVDLLHLIRAERFSTGAVSIDKNLTFPTITTEVKSRGRRVLLETAAIPQSPDLTVPKVSLHVVVKGNKDDDGNFTGSVTIDFTGELHAGDTVQIAVDRPHRELLRELGVAPAPAPLPPFAPPPVAKVPPPATEPAAGKAGTGLHHKAAKKHGRHHGRHAHRRR